MKLGEVLEHFAERPHDSVPPVLTLTEKNGFVLQSDRFKKRLATEDTSDYKLIRRGDIAFNPYLLWAGAVAQNSLVDAGIISPLYPTFRVREGFDAGFVGRLLLTPRLVQMYDAIAFGSVPRRRRSSVEDFLNLDVPELPPLPEQRRIASILDQADALRAKRRRVRTCLDLLGRSVFLAQFGNLSANSTVAEVAARAPGSIRTGPFGSQLLHSEFVDSGIAVLGLDNVVSNDFQWGERRFITELKYGSLRRYTVHPGDVLISIMGTTGRCVVVPDDIPLAINTKHLCAITPDRAVVLPQYLRACFLWHPTCREHLARQTKGAIMSGLNMGIIKEMPLPLPSLADQSRFAGVLAQLRKVVRQDEQQAARLDLLYSSLQSRAFHGGCEAAPAR